MFYSFKVITTFLKIELVTGDRSVIYEKEIFDFCYGKYSKPLTKIKILQVKPPSHTRRDSEEFRLGSFPWYVNHFAFETSVTNIVQQFTPSPTVVPVPDTFEYMTYRGHSYSDHHETFK